MDTKKKIATDATVATNEFDRYVNEQHTVTLIGGTIVKLNFSVETANYSPEDLHELLSYIAMCSHEFYLTTGRDYEKTVKDI